MKAIIKIKNSENEEIINVESIENIYSFFYEDSYEAKNNIKIDEKGIELMRTIDTHNTHLYLKINEKSFVEIETSEGKLRFDAKVLAFERKDDIITLVYKLNESINSIEIRYLGDNL